MNDIRDHALPDHSHLLPTQPFRYPFTGAKGLGEGVECRVALLAVVAEEMRLLGEARHRAFMQGGDEDVGLLAGSKGRVLKPPLERAKKVTQQRVGRGMLNGRARHRPQR